ncbi:MAG: hypothetical protein H8M99_02130 [Gloeobacteraceae cyanobacterium ES-bin-144]|nr:hypothetical protein [Verrucomicrobiales bacterium]
MSVPLTPLPIASAGLASSNTKPWNILPFPQASSATLAPNSPSPLPACPTSTLPTAAGFPKSWPAPLATLPFPSPTTQSPFTIALETPESFPVEKTRSISSPKPATNRAEPDFTDDDLREAFGPIVEQAVRKAVYANENGIDTYLEPMLRATIRRALAEYAPASRPFHAPGMIDRLIWHVKALFTSRSYEDIFFEKTRRFQLEEVFLLDNSTLALISFASCDPARHASARRVAGTVHRLALQLRDDDGKIRPTFDSSDQRKIVSRQGSFVVLMAILRGNPGELVFADLEFALRRIEDHFREQFQQSGSDLLHPLQPFLEDCLLIQSPASAA